MINLYYMNGDIYIFNVNDWINLRKNHRIIGEIIGNTTFVPSLPLKLLPEEVILLSTKGIARVFEFTNNLTSPTEEDKAKNVNFEKQLLEHEQKEYRNIRKVQLESMLDKIVEKRRKNGDNRTSEDIFVDELEKSCVVDKTNFIWPILLHPNIKQDTLKSIPQETLAPLSTTLKTLVYKDLWERNYYVTQGSKFGGDFLVYSGDPVAYHAVFIVRCVNKQQPIAPSEIVAFGRLGTSVKKKAVLASIDDKDSVSYITINWIDA